MKTKILILFAIMASPFILIGQGCDTICDGRDFWCFCLVKERLPDTIWMEISAPTEITLTIDLDIEYDRIKADSAGWGYAHVRRASSIWGTAKDTSGTSLPYTRYFSEKWTYYDDEMIPHTASDEMEQIIETVLSLAGKCFVGYPCKTRVLKVRGDVTKIPKKRFKGMNHLRAEVRLWVFPKEKNVEFK